MGPLALVHVREMDVSDEALTMRSRGLSSSVANMQMGLKTTFTEGPDPLAFGAPALWFLAAHDLFDQDLSCHG